MVSRRGPGRNPRAQRLPLARAREAGDAGGVRVHLIDGTYELFRSWFGAPRVPDGTGREVGAVRGLTRSLARLLREGVTTHAGVAFDSCIESFRNRLFDGYKTGEGLDRELLAQFPLAEEATRALGLTVWPMTEFEADDALAAAAHHLARDPRVHEVLLVSPDKDLAQCVSGTRVVRWDRARDERLDESGVRARFGVPPASIPDWLALVGDAADGIPGVPRWGEKSASMVLGRWGHLETIPPSERDWEVKVRGAAALARSLAEHREAANLYRTLATLRRDALPSADADSLAWRGVDGSALERLTAVLGAAEVTRLAALG